MVWSVEFDDDFLDEFRALSEPVRIAILARVSLLETFGPELGRPHADTLNGSDHKNMKELRCDADDGVWRIAFAFDPARSAILLVAGDKSGTSEAKFYRKLIAKADKRFGAHLNEIERKKK